MGLPSRSACRSDVHHPDEALSAARAAIGCGVSSHRHSAPSPAVLTGPIRTSSIFDDDDSRWRAGNARALIGDRHIAVNLLQLGRAALRKQRPEAVSVRSRTSIGCGGPKYRGCTDDRFDSIRTRRRCPGRLIKPKLRRQSQPGNDWTLYRLDGRRHRLCCLQPARGCGRRGHPITTLAALRTARRCSADSPRLRVRKRLP